MRPDGFDGTVDGAGKRGDDFEVLVSAGPCIGENWKREGNLDGCGHGVDAEGMETKKGERIEGRGGRSKDSFLFTFE